MRTAQRLVFSLAYGIKSGNFSPAIYRERICIQNLSMEGKQLRKVFVVPQLHGSVHEIHKKK